MEKGCVQAPVTLGETAQLPGLDAYIFRNTIRASDYSSLSLNTRNTLHLILHYN